MLKGSVVIEILNKKYKANKVNKLPSIIPISTNIQTSSTFIPKNISLNFDSAIPVPILSSQKTETPKNLSFSQIEFITPNIFPKNLSFTSPQNDFTTPINNKISSDSLDELLNEYDQILEKNKGKIPVFSGLPMMINKDKIYQYETIIDIHFQGNKDYMQYFNKESFLLVIKPNCIKSISWVDSL